jgi:hypothetical protein
MEKKKTPQLKFGVSIVWASMAIAKGMSVTHISVNP